MSVYYSTSILSLYCNLFNLALSLDIWVVSQFLEAELLSQRYEEFFKVFYVRCQTTFQNACPILHCPLAVHFFFFFSFLRYLNTSQPRVGVREAQCAHAYF